MDNQEQKLIDEARHSLERVQNYDVMALPRENELGKSFSFSAAVQPAQRLIDFFKRISISIIDDLPQDSITKVRDLSNSTYMNIQITDMKEIFI